MKAENDLSLWSIIERLQRRLERQGMTPATADRALSQAALPPVPARDVAGQVAPGYDVGSWSGAFLGSRYVASLFWM